MQTLFGSVASKRIVAPAYNSDGTPEYSVTMEDFESNIMRTMEASPVVYVLDSIDALPTESEMDLQKEQRTAREKGKAIPLSYGTERAKTMSRVLRLINAKMVLTGSFLFILSQTREKIGAMAFGSNKTRSGGKAIKFFSSWEIWSNTVETLKTKVGEKSQLPVGIRSSFKVSKNKNTGKVREVVFPIFYDYGIDDIGGCVDWLVEEGYWKKDKSGITNDDGFTGQRKAIIADIEANSREKELRKIVGHYWKIRENKVSNGGRKKRYE
jgi:hypothetical protein